MNKQPDTLSTSPSTEQTIDNYVQSYEWLGRFSKEEYIDVLLANELIGPGSVIVLEFPAKKPTPKGVETRIYKVAYAVKTDKKTKRVGRPHVSLWYLYFEKLPLGQKENPFWARSPHSTDGAYFKRMLRLHSGNWNIYRLSSPQGKPQTYINP